MTTYHDSLSHLTAAIHGHPSIVAYKEVQQQLSQLTNFEQKAYQMKRYQQDAQLFQKIAKEQAAVMSENKARELEEILNCQPLIEDYREKMQNASDLIQYITKSIEDQLNKELTDGKS
ncbi:YlbF family regulator [Streptococcus castoreus]|uniref:YlbF family regulator n=1 Tax=Streptococcus castoreus TaxID=254786 RepID=UPI00042999CD|nr:YlbF family regulator [Streptococcus castoreus]